MRRLLMTTFFVLSSLSASGGERWKELPVCTENPIRIDWGRESPNVGAQ
jgi:hypothetical protein